MIETAMLLCLGRAPMWLTGGVRKASLEVIDAVERGHVEPKLLLGPRAVLSKDPLPHANHVLNCDAHRVSGKGQQEVVGRSGGSEAGSMSPLPSRMSSCPDLRQYPCAMCSLHIKIGAAFSPLHQ